VKRQLFDTSQLPLFPHKRKVPTEVTGKKMRRNIRVVFRAAHSVEVKHGISWYRRANKLCFDWSVQYGIPEELAAHILAALSPNSRWEENVRDARSLIREEIEMLPRVHRFRTYGANVEKARRMVSLWREGLDWKQVLRGNKVTAFARNIALPAEDSSVTVDFHALSVAYGYRFTASNCPRISDTLYREVSAAYTAVARLEGLRMHELQAVTWLAWKRLHKV